MEKVYFIKHKDINPIKIGRTNDLAKRLASFKNASPYGIEVIGVIDTNDSINLEQKIHHIFRNNRLNGEWFSITVEACQDIINIYKDADYINAKNLFELSYNKKDVITNDVDSEDIKKLYEVVSLKYNYELGFRTKVVLNQKEIKERFGIKRNESIKFFMDSVGLKYKTNGLKGFSKKGYMFYIK